MKKRYPTIFVLGAITGFLICTFRPHNVPHETTIDTMVYYTKRKALEAENKAISDSLDAARFVLANREFDLAKAHMRTQQLLNIKHETNFVRTVRDVQRDSAIQYLYHSYPLPR